MDKVVNIFLQLIYSIVSAAILVLCYREPRLSMMAWIAFVPLFVGIHKKGTWLTVLMSTVFGIAYMHGVFHWILDVQGYRLFHHFLLAIYFGIYFICFGLCFKLTSSWLDHRLAFLSIPFVWVSIEFLRSNLLFIALPLGLLGHTQYLNRSVIQIANIGGAYIVSFIVVLINAAIASVAVTFMEKKQIWFPVLTQKPKPFLRTNKPLLTTAIFAATAILLYGLWVGTQAKGGLPVQVALIQANIAQDEKWDPQYAAMIMDTYSRLTLKASALKPDLIIWPETAMPGSASTAHNYLMTVKELSISAGSPILIGSALGSKFNRQDSRNREYRNSALLVTPRTEMIVDQLYDKMKLFPFGEYLPHDNFLPWQLLRISPANHYSAGETYTVFQLPAFTFATMICWETLFPGLCREFTKRGAQFIVNISNEARFGKSEASYLILAANVFRAVENGIYIARCTNTGISCIIDPLGKITGRVRDEQGNDLFVQGTLSGTVQAKNAFSFYTRHGDIFAKGCAAATLVLVLWAVSMRSSKINRTEMNQ